MAFANDSFFFLSIKPTTETSTVPLSNSGLHYQVCDSVQCCQTLPTGVLMETRLERQVVRVQGLSQQMGVCVSIIYRKASQRHFH